MWLRWVEGLGIFVAVIAALNVVSLVLGPDSPVVDVVVWSVIVAAILSSYLLRGVRLGGRSQTRLFGTSLKQGRVIDGADRASWRYEIARQAERRRKARRRGKVVLTSFAALYALLFLLFLVLDGWQEAVIIVVPFLVLGPLLAILFLLVIPRTIRRIEVLERELASDA